jgi:hypothetical protein
MVVKTWMPATSAGMTVERQSANQFVIPGRRASAGPGIQTQGTVLCFWIPGSRFQRAPE